MQWRCSTRLVAWHLGALLFCLQLLVICCDGGSLLR